jgi:DNA modification methylase
MFRRNLVSLQGDASQLPLRDESVDLIVTSPPYFALRDYQDGGESVKGQVGNEPTPQEFLESLWKCTEEWMRVLKPRGSIFVNLGDKYAGGGGGPPGNIAPRGTVSTHGYTWGYKAKSLMNLPARYAIGCTDQLGLIQRAEIVWSKPNGLPESVRDRVRRSHEMMFHFTKQGDYYQAVDRIRTTHKDPKGKSRKDREDDGSWRAMDGAVAGHELGKLPPSVWEIATSPLVVPKWLKDEMESLWYELDESEKFDVDHFAAFPPALVQRVIDGWSPVHVCSACGQGRFPVSTTAATGRVREDSGDGGRGDRLPGYEDVDRSPWQEGVQTRIIGNACACTPFEDHPENRGKDWRGGVDTDRSVSGQRMGKEFQGNGHPARSGGEWKADGGAERTRQRLEPGREDETTRFPQNQFGRGQVREYLLDQWEPAPTTPGVVLDPFGGTGTTAIVAAIMGRRGITCDLSFDYAGRMVPWRANDRSQMRSLLGSKK